MTDIIGIAVFGICILIFILIALIYLFKYLYETYFNFEFFNANANLQNTKPMNFKYLNDPNYDNNILNQYYLNDDTKINGVRVVYHPYMESQRIGNNNSYGLLWNSPVLSNDYYNKYGVRL